MPRTGDTETVLITNLPEGHKLWRCLNRAGVPYSYITDKDGCEMMSIVTEKESAMILSFYQYILHRYS